MNKGYQVLTENIKGRTNPEHINLQKSFADELSSISYSDVLVYIRYAMKSVEPTYTQISKLAGENVKKHLGTLEDVEFKFQGSVMTNTHIKAHSDIDLVAISSKFYTWDSYNSQKYINEQEYRSKLNSWDIDKLIREQTSGDYVGNALDDLRKIRFDSETILQSKYITCDITQPKCIKIVNRDLNRKVDIVVANWYDDVRSIIYDKGENRGIQIYNKVANRKENPDYPFISIKKINDRGNSTNSRLRKMIRFIKNIKADSDLQIELSSFDINAICYDIDPTQYQYKTFIELIPVIYRQLQSICTNDIHADNIVSVDEREYIFRGNSSKLNDVQKVLSEVQSVYLDLKKINQYI